MKQNSKFTLKTYINLEMILSFAAMVMALSVATKFMAFNETRPGSVLNDPILLRFKAVDVTWFTFLLIYGGIISGFLTLLANPKRLVIGIQAYALMVIFRMCAMYLTPLDPVSSIIILRDPFVEIFGTGEPLVKDLFFSGHTASLCIIFFALDHYWMKRIMFFGVLAVAFCVVVQHVHYSIDVFSAPFYSFAAYRIVVSIHEYFENKK